MSNSDGSSDRHAFEQIINKVIYGGMADVAADWDDSRHCYATFAHHVAYKVWQESFAQPAQAVPDGLIEFLDFCIESKKEIMRIQEVREHVRDLERWKYALLAARPTSDTAPDDNRARAKLYDELLFAVGQKFPNETRHETALRYIRNAEGGTNRCDEAGSAQGDRNE